MLKKLIAAAAIALGVSTPAWAEWQNVIQMNRHIEQTNFIVDKGCSGTLISLEERLVLTNYHCVERFVGTKQKRVTDPETGIINQVTVRDFKTVPITQIKYRDHEAISQATYATDIVHYNADVDLALLQFKLDEIPFTIEADLFEGRKVYRGEPVYVVGNPLGMDLTVMKGVVSSTNRLVKVQGGEFPYYQVDAGITGGNSGGALYNERGYLIGVPAAAARGTVIGLAIPYTEVIRLLDSYHEELEKEQEENDDNNSEE